MNSGTRTLTLFLLFVLVSLISAFSAFSVISQIKDEGESISSAISIRSAALILTTELKDNSHEKIGLIRESMEKSFKTLMFKFENASFGVFSSEILDYQIKLYKQFSKLNITLQEIESKKNLSKEYENLKNEMKVESENLKKLSNILAKRLVSDGVTTSQIYFFSTQSERISSIEEMLSNEFGFKQIEKRNSFIVSTLNEFKGVIDQLKDSESKISSAINLDKETRKVLFAVTKVFEKYKRLVTSMTNNESAYSELSELYGLAQSYNNPILSNSSDLARMITSSANNRVMTPGFVLGSLALSAMLLIGSLVSLYYYSQENSVLDNERIKAEKKAFKKLVSEIKHIDSGDMTQEIDVSNMYTSGIALIINKTIKKIKLLISNIKSQSELTKESIEKAISAEENIMAMKSSLNESQQKEKSRLAQFERKYKAFNEQFNSIPEKLKEQQTETTKLIDGVSENYKLASQLTNKARNISEQFKIQSETSQTLFSEASQISKAISEIESDIFNIQIQGAGLGDSMLNEILKNLANTKKLCDSTKTKTSILIEASSGNQQFIENMREDVLKLNGVAEKASKHGGSIQRDSVEIMANINDFKLFLDRLIEEIDSIFDQISESRNKVTSSIESQAVVIQSMRMVNSIVSEMTSIINEYKVK